MRKTTPLEHVYDRWHQTVHGAEDPTQDPSLADWHRNALTLLPVLQGCDVLEVGCGAGDFALHLARQGARVTAVDFSPKAIELAHAKARAAQNSVHFQVADAHHLPFADGSFHVVVSCECLEHVANPSGVLAEFFRVLRPQGRLILTTENYSNALMLVWLACRLRGMPFNSGDHVQPIEHFFLFWNIRRKIQQAGFRLGRMIGSHHVFLVFPGCPPGRFVKERFESSVWAGLFRPWARHMAFEAMKR